VSSQPFALSSSAFAAQAAIPARFTCDGADVSPPLAWVGAPPGTQSIVLVVRDPDARNFVHWIAYEIPAAQTGSLPEAIARSAPSPKQGRNDFGRDGYGGPCPPSGTHHYVFRLSALDRTLGLRAGKTAAEVEAAMAGHILATTELTGTYKRH
jgi:Raf kinase inhibitor-like YbhB/YbcL family protein